MRVSRYVAVIVGAALAVSFALPGAVSAQEDKYLQAMRAYQQGNMPEAERIFREVCDEYEDLGVPWGWCHMMLGAVLGQPGRGASKRQEALAQLEIAKELVTDDVTGGVAIIQVEHKRLFVMAASAFSLRQSITSLSIRLAFAMMV